MKCTVLMPVYNGESYIRLAMESVCRQTFRDFEFIVVDDGSTDSTLAIVSDFLWDPRVRLLQLPHGGVCVALNKGLWSAKGEWIIRIDADDIMGVHRIERQLSFLDQHREIAGSGCYYEIINEDGAACGPMKPPLTTPAQVMARLCAGLQIIFPHPTMTFRRDIALKLGGYREEFYPCEDVELFLRMIEHGYMLVIQPEYLMQLRFHVRSISAQNTRIQVQLNELIFENYNRRRSGQPEISFSEHQKRTRSNPISYLLSELRIHSEIFLRRRGMARMKGHRFSAHFYGLSAALLDPYRTYRKLSDIKNRSQVLERSNKR